MGATIRPSTEEPLQKLKKMDYIAYLVDDSGKRIKLDVLYRDNDQVYKVRYTTKDVQQIDEILQYNNVSIIITDYKSEQEVLRGRLKRLQ